MSYRLDMTPTGNAPGRGSGAPVVHRPDRAAPPDRDQSPALVAWRFATGSPLDGLPRTDAGWFRWGDSVYLDLGHMPGTWSKLPRALRALTRWAAAGGAYLLAQCYANAPEATTRGVLIGGVGAATATTAGLGWRAIDRCIGARHHREAVLPVHAELRRIIGIPGHIPADFYLVIPPDYADSGAIKVEFPFGYSGNETTNGQVLHVLKTKLGLTDFHPTWHLRGADSYLTMTKIARPPKLVTLDDTRIMDAHTESAPAIGLDSRSQPVTVNFDADSPHVLVNAGSGGGKSVIIQALITPGLAHGWAVSVLDRKQHSLRFLRGIPGVDYWKTIPEMHEGLIALGIEAARRNLIVDAWEDDDALPDVGPRHMIIIEEANSALPRLADYWKEIRANTDPKRSPALAALDEIMFMGRAVRMHVTLVAQSATARTLGGPEMRENFAVRIMARYTQNAWRMLVPEVNPVPRSERHAGRAQVVMAGIAAATQIAYGGDPGRRTNRAREMALSGVRPVTDGGSPAWQTYKDSGLTVPGHVAMSQRPTSPTEQGNEPGTVSSTPALRVVEGDGNLVTLSSAAPQLNIPLTALRKASQRPGFPAPEVKGRRGSASVYRLDLLIRWADSRPSSQEASAHG